MMILQLNGTRCIRISLLVILATAICCSDKSKGFMVLDFSLNDSTQAIQFAKWKTRNLRGESVIVCNADVKVSSDSLSEIKCFLEDEHYHVFATNYGEWGGMIFFEDKLSENTYVIGCSELLMVNYRDSSYYITDVNTDFSYPRTRILKIDDPAKLASIPRERLPRNLHDHDSLMKVLHSLYKIGSITTVLDTVNLTASLFYPYGNRNYLVYTAKNPFTTREHDEPDTTYVGEIVEGELKTIQMILPFPTITSQFRPNFVDDSIYTYNYDFKTYHGTEKKGETVVLIDSHGSIFIKKDTIVVGYSHYDERRLKKSKRE
jgi:hypothetical protein